MNCTGPLDGIDEELGCVCFSWSSTDVIHQSMTEDFNAKFIVGDWGGLKRMGTLRGIVHMVKTKFSVKPFC